MIRGLLLISLISISMSVNAGPTDDNHVHVEQVGSGDDLELNIDQMGYGNTIEFSFDHSGNVFNLSQSGNDNYIGWVSYWGCLLYTSPSPRDWMVSRMPSSA